MEGITISLAAARVNAGLTQRDVAEALGVTQNTVVAWEKGETEPRISQARALSDLYAMPLDVLFVPLKSQKVDETD